MGVSLSGGIHHGLLLQTLAKLPAIYLALTLIRGGLIALLSRIMAATGNAVTLPWQGVVFATVRPLQGIRVAQIT